MGWRGGPVRQPYAGVDYIPPSGTKNLTSGVLLRHVWNKNKEMNTDSQKDDT